MTVLRFYLRARRSLSKSNHNLYFIQSHFRLAEELLEKESINLPDILRVLGERPFPLKENVREYLEELQERKHKVDEDAAAAKEAADNAAANTPVEDANKKDDNDNNNDDS